MDISKSSVAADDLDNYPMLNFILDESQAV